MITLTPKIKETHPGYRHGIMVMRNVKNPPAHAVLDSEKKNLEERLRARYAKCGRAELRAQEPLCRYDAYYKSYGSTYHVMLQLESVAHKAKALPSVAALVEAMFMSELKNMLLTAGHDFSVLRPPLTLHAAEGVESFTTINGSDKTLSRNDIYMLDGDGIIGSILNGPDRRTRITPATTDVLFSVFAPCGISEELIQDHLKDIAANVSVIAPEATIERLEIITV